MKTTIQSLHFTPIETLNYFLTEKLNELEQFNPEIISGIACLKLDKSKTTDNNICEIKLEMPGYNLYAIKQCATFEEAIEQAVETLEIEINKHKK